MASDYEYGGRVVQAHLVMSLREYVQRGRMPGGFLQAVLENDFVDAGLRADSINASNLPAFAAYLSFEMPRQCWGSAETVRAWVAKLKQPCGKEIHDDLKGVDLKTFLQSFEYKGVQGFEPDCLVMANCARCHSTVTFEVRNTPVDEVRALIEGVKP